MSDESPSPDTDDDWVDFVDSTMLQRRVTLDEYLYESEVFRRGLVARHKVDADRANLAARTQPDDEWWVWIAGTEPLMQQGGLALVRQGRIIWARQDWIS
jgi:hypothetical protein